jgi:hypothetical protein
MQMRNKLLSSILAGSFSLFLGTVFLPSEAQAGFQWVPSSSDATATTSSSTAAVGNEAPVSTRRAARSSTALSKMPAPLVIEGTAPASESAEAAADDGQAMTLPSSSAEIAAAPTAKSAQSLGSLPAAPMPTASAAPATEKAVKGFASNVPLAVALRQILPPEYGFSLAQDVSANATVSWRGGSSWRTTLEDMLQKAGLAMEENGTMIRVVHAGIGASSSPVALTPTPAPAPRPMAEAKPVALAPGMASGAAKDVGGGHYLTPPSGLAPMPAVDVTPTLRASTEYSNPETPHTTAIDSWVADKGETLHKVLEKWARRANVELSWQAEFDYPLQASLSFNGSFEEGVRNLLAGLQDAKPQPYGTLHVNQTSGQSVLVVQTRGNNYND